MSRSKYLSCDKLEKKVLRVEDDQGYLKNIRKWLHIIPTIFYTYLYIKKNTKKIISPDQLFAKRFQDAILWSIKRLHNYAIGSLCLIGAPNIVFDQRGSLVGVLTYPPQLFRECVITIHHAMLSSEEVEGYVCSYPLDGPFRIPR